MSRAKARVVCRSLAVGALVVAPSLAQAGGFAVREQSASAQGSAFAGSAAGYDLSSMFWNPAAAGIAGWGTTTESHVALIIPNSDLTGSAPVGGATSTDIGRLAFVPASYGAYRINKDFVLGISINSPFGLTTKPDNVDWVGRNVGRTTKVFTANAAPILSYQVAPGLFVGAGVQFEYMSLLLKFATGGVGSPSAYADVDDNLGVGFTAGLLWQPSPSTSIGLGFRSSVTHDLKGDLVVGAGKAPINADFDTPEIVTLSIRQAIAPHVRVLGTFEWTNWSRFDVVPIIGSGVLLGTDRALSGPWHDGWLLSGGIEYDMSRQLTVRGGLAFEKSPIQNANERLIQVPDSDRWWTSVGLTYRLSQNMAIDLAYTHIFFDDAPFDRNSLTNAVHLVGEADQSADIIAASLKMKW
jgi:long-chain fatty acid transport protein